MDDDDITFNSESFHEDDLRLAPLQYAYRAISGMQFEIGDRVFLKSNPEVPLVVANRSDTAVFCHHEETPGVDGMLFMPEMLCPYDAASIMKSTALDIVLHLN